jgi:hypothetical protein
MQATTMKQDVTTTSQHESLFASILNMLNKRFEIKNTFGYSGFQLWLDHSMSRQARQMLVTDEKAPKLASNTFLSEFMDGNSRPF